MLAFKSHIDEIAAHLKCAVAQTLPTDDRIIADHVRDALAIVETIRREIAAQLTGQSVFPAQSAAAPKNFPVAQLKETSVSLNTGASGDALLKEAAIDPRDPDPTRDGPKMTRHRYRPDEGRVKPRYGSSVSEKLLFFSGQPTETGCIPWKGHRNAKGYSVASMGLAHRVAYEVRHGAIPAGLEIDHLCRNRWCVNPNHLEAVSRRENVLRSGAPSALHAVKTHCRLGHEFTPENTYLMREGGRRCRICAAGHSRKSKAKRSAEGMREKAISDDPSREGIFRSHNCWRCNNGAKPCHFGHPNQCEYPHARND